jgi:hypothetical protein
VPGLSQQGHRTGLKGSGGPPQGTLGTRPVAPTPSSGRRGMRLMSPSLIDDTETREDRSTMRWAVGFALMMALVFALTAGVHFGAAYIDQMLAR